MLKGTQLTLSDVDDNYREFVEKFKPKKTTDDCYTPENIYNAIRDWACERYGIEPAQIVRPFWPGGDYERFDYPDDCVVLDNPPFSIISKIVRHYTLNEIKFFLFSPYLTTFGAGDCNCCTIITASSITYENGARVDTAFKTNLDRRLAFSCPELAEIIRRIDAENTRAKTKELPKYAYPDNVMTAAMLGYMAKHGVEFEVYPEEAHFIRSLDAQRAAGKAIFGGGYLLSGEAAAEKAAAEKAAAEKAAAEKAAAEKAAAEKAAAIRWPLSDNELEIIRGLGRTE